MVVSLSLCVSGLLLSWFVFGCIIVFVCETSSFSLLEGAGNRRSTAGSSVFWV